MAENNKSIKETNIENQEKLNSVEYLIQKINGAGIQLHLSKEQMKEILEAGKDVQKMAVKYGTNQDIQMNDENTFNGYGTYVVSVNEDNARQLGIKIASRKYGGTFYINNQPFTDFLQEKNFSPYWTKIVSDIKDNSVDKLTHIILSSDVKGNASLEREQNSLSTLLSLDLIEYKREQTFLYSVNIPDNDNTNYLLYNNPIGIEHAKKINEQLEKLGTSWQVSRNDTGKKIYFDVLSNHVFDGNQKQSSEFLKNLGYVGMQMDNANYIVFNDKDMSITDRVQFMKDVNGEVYGFAYQGEIYADENLVNSNVLAHEYTHIWDKYVQNNNPELWQYGKDILKGTSLWQEITEDKNYENLKTDDEILSECHSRIVGKMAAQILEKIEREDGGLTRDRVIDWDKEVSQYIAEEFSPELGNENLKEFLSMPMKDLMNEIQISKKWFEKTPIQLQKEQEREDIQTTLALNNIAKDIVIEPYSRKPEDIESMKFFVANVSGESIENITNQQSQAFIDNLGTPYEDYLTVKTDGTFEHTHNSSYSSEISKTTEPKKILSIIDDFANDHQAGRSEGSEQVQDFEFIHSLNETIKSIDEMHNTMLHSNTWDDNFPPVYSHALFYGDSINDKEYSENVKTALLVGKAKRGNKDAAMDLINETVNPEVIKELHKNYPNAIVCAVDGLEASGHNMIPLAYQDFLKQNGFVIDTNIEQSAKAHHTGADNLDKLLNRVRFKGEVQNNKDYILLDDHISMGSTLRDMKNYIESNGGNVVAITTLTAPEKDYKISLSKENYEKLNQYGEPLNELLQEYGITDNLRGITDREAKEIVGLLSDRGRNPETQEGTRRIFCLRCRQIQEDYLLKNPELHNSNQQQTKLYKDFFNYSNGNSVEFENSTYNYNIVSVESTPKQPARQELHLSKNGITFAQLPYAAKHFNNLKPDEIQKEVIKQLEEAKRQIPHKIGKDFFDYSNEKSVDSELDSARETIKKQNQLLYGKNSITINGKKRTFEKGLFNAFPEVVKRLDIEIERNKNLTKSYNNLAKSYNDLLVRFNAQNIMPVSQISPTDYDTRSD